ncbi:hypothetical protein ACPTGU_30840, partial [Pseudomonas aeruginosa]
PPLPARSVANSGSLAPHPTAAPWTGRLRALALDCQGVERVAGETSGVALIVVDDSTQNAIVIVAGGNAHLSPAVLA